jgi:predicted O-methyltransferase YrrM
MTDRRLTITDDIHRYLVEHSVREPEVLARLRATTASLPQAQMQIGPEQGQLMALLAKLMGAKRCIEIGVFTGYSSLAVALALPEDGRIVACDVSEEWTAIARRFWREAGVEPLRLWIRRCGQAGVRHVLRNAPEAVATGWPDSTRQHAMVRCGCESERSRAERNGAARAQRQAASR